LALGVVATALIGILGLLSVGLKSFHGAITTTVTTSIVNQIMNDVKQTDYVTMTQITPSTPTPSATPQPMTLPYRYFDDEGTDVTPIGGGTLPSNTIYDVAIFITPAPTLPNSTLNLNLASIQIYITYHPGSSPYTITAPANLSSSNSLPLAQQYPNTTLYTALLANTDSLSSNTQ